MKSYIFLLILIFNFCNADKLNSLYIPSNTYPNYNQSTFEEYVNETKIWLKNNRTFLTNDTQLELKSNTPFEKKPQQRNITKGILLVHGLGDSSGYFDDLSKELVKSGFLVRTILLIGHGSKPADLLNIEFETWEKQVLHHIKLLQEEVDELWLGGFSTGTNLITSYALENQSEISGLLLFSPGFASNQENMLPFSGMGRYFKTWLFQNKNSTNILRYESLSLNASYLYYQSLKDVSSKLKDGKFSKPVFVTISQDDSVIKSNDIVSIFSNNFTHPKSRLLWFGSDNKTKDNRIISLNSYLPNQRIANFSHLSVLFNENNFFYGKESYYRMFRNGQEKEFNPLVDELWYSAWGLKEEGKYFARLTWNPYFNETINLMNEVINTK